MWGGALAFLLALALYAITRAPDLTFVDAGELAAVASTAGIAHPTGYPLYTLLGRTLIAFPGPVEPLDRLSLFSAGCAAGAVALAFASLRRIVRGLGFTPGIATAAAMSASLTLAMGRTVWSQAVIVEVYALHLLFVALLFYLTLAAPKEAGGASGGGLRALLLASYLAGLAIGNHLSAALLLPAFAFGVVRGRRTAGLGRSLPLLALAFLAGLSVYLYLPIRSALDPMLDWGDPETPGTFYRHVTAAVYRVWFLTSAEVAMRQLARFFTSLPVQMTPVALAPAVVGLVLLWRRQAVLAHATVLLFILNVFYAVNYDIHDIESYFLPAYFVLAVWMGVGMAGGLELAARAIRRRAAESAVRWGASLALPVFGLVWNAGAASQRDNHLVPDYTAAMFRSLDPNAVILSRQWDEFCSASIYEQLVRGVRRDVTVLEKELLRRSWYARQLERWDRELAGACREPLEAFRAGVVPFETGGRWEYETLQQLYVEMINCLLEQAMAGGRPTYLTADAVEPGIARGLTQVPAGLAMRLYRSPPAVPPPMPAIGLRALRAAYASGNEVEHHLARKVLSMGTRRAIYLFANGRLDEALAAADSVLAMEPTYPNALEVRKAILAQRAGGAPPERISPPASPLEWGLPPPRTRPAPRPRRPRRRRRRSGQSVKRPSTPRSMSSDITDGSLMVKTRALSRRA